MMRWLLSLAHPPRLADDSGKGRLIILRHHRVYAAGEHPLYRLGVSERVFHAQLDLLVGAGLTPMSVADGLEHLDHGEPGTWLALTFDDGYADNVRLALPMLEEHAASATFYLTAGLMEERRAPWWDEVEHALTATRRSTATWNPGSPVVLELASAEGRRRALRAILPWMRADLDTRERRLASLREVLGVSAPAPCALATWEEARSLVDAGMEVGAHTLHHPHLSLLPREAQQDEVGGSVDLIQRRLGVRARGLAYPGGDHDAVTVDVTKACGLEYAVTTRAGDNPPGAPRYELQRRGLYEGDCLGPGGRFSRRLALAELDGAFDRLREWRKAVGA